MVVAIVVVINGRSGSGGVSSKHGPAVVYRGQRYGSVEEYAAVGPLVRFGRVLLCMVDEEGRRWTVVVAD